MKKSNKQIKEMSATGGGVTGTPGATVTPGSGEGVATKNAFGGAGGDGKKKKKRSAGSLMSLLKEMIEEETAELEPTPAGKDALSVSQKAVQLLKNQFLGTTFEESIKNPDILEKLYEKMEKTQKLIDKESNKYEHTDEDMFDKLEELSGNITSMQNTLYDLKEAFKEANKSSFNINYNK